MYICVYLLYMYVCMYVSIYICIMYTTSMSASTSLPINIIPRCQRNRLDTSGRVVQSLLIGVYKNVLTTIATDKLGITLKKNSILI